MAEELPPPTVMRWACIVLDYLGLGFILIAPEEWVRLRSLTEFFDYLAIGAAFLFVGVMAPRLASKLSPKWGLLVGLALCAILNYELGNPIWRAINTGTSWLSGTHGKWFERLIGAAYLLIVIALLLLASGLILGVRNRAARQKRKGFLEYKLEAEVAISKMPSILADLSKIMTEIGPAFERHTAALNSATTTEGHLRISKEASSSLDKYSSRMRRVGKKYRLSGEAFCSGLDGWSNWIEESRPQNIDRTFYAAMREMNERLATSSQQIRDYGETIARIKGISSTLDAAAERHARVVASVLEITLRIKQACENNLRVLGSLG